MKKENIVKLILSVMCMLALAACNAGANSSIPTTPAPLNPPESSSMNIPDENTSDAPEGFDVEIRGSVVEFSDSFCIITPVETGEDDRLGYQAAPGYEDPEKNITVHYQEGCVIQIAEINVASGERNLEDASITDIKKETSLIIYGKWTDERELNATTVYIARYQ